MKDFYSKNYKKYMLVPAVLFVVLLAIIFVYPGISLGLDMTGGNVIILRSDKALSNEQIENALSGFGLAELSVSAISSPGGFGAYIEYSKDPKVLDAEDFIEKAQNSIDNDAESIAYSVSAIQALGKTAANYPNAKLALAGAQDALAAYKEAFSKSLELALTQKLDLGANPEFQRREVSPTLGQAFFDSAIFVAIVAAILLAIIIFISFRQIVPSMGIIFAMIFDVLAGLAGMSLLNIPVSLIAVSTLLMLVGYSVDTDIMLASRILKEKNSSPFSQANASLKTGLTMTGTSMMALIAMIIISSFYQIEIVFQIAVILFFGQLGDIISTWLMNAPILLWFTEKKGALQ